MSLRTPYAAIALLSVVSGCGLYSRPTASPPGGPAVATKFCGFLFDGRANEARFSLDLILQRGLPAGTLVEVSFENPLDRDQPLVVARELKGGERELRIVSTPVKGITRREYAMVARVYGSRDKQSLLATHAESCRAPFGQGDMGIEYR